MTTSEEYIFIFLLFFGILLIFISIAGLIFSQTSSKNFNVTYGGVFILGPIVIPFGYLSNKKFLTVWIIISIILFIILIFSFLRR